MIQHPFHYDEIQFLLKSRTPAKPPGTHRWAWRRAWGVWRVCWHCRTLQRQSKPWGRLRLLGEAPGVLWRSYRLAQMAVPLRRPYDARDKMLAGCLVLGGMLAGAVLLALWWLTI